MHPQFRLESAVAAPQKVKTGLAAAVFCNHTVLFRICLTRSCWLFP